MYEINTAKENGNAPAGCARGPTLTTKYSVSIKCNHVELYFVKTAMPLTSQPLLVWQNKFETGTSTAGKYDEAHECGPKEIFGGQN